MSESNLQRRKLNKEERRYIADNMGQPDEVLGELLQRKPSTIRRYKDFLIKRKKTKEEGLAPDALELLHGMPNWKQFKQEFDKGELIIAEKMWCRFFAQFGGDVISSEQMQIIDVIRFDIMISRILVEKQRLSNQIKQTEAAIDVLSRTSPELRTPEDNEAIDRMRVQLIQYQTVTESRTKEFLQYQSNKDSLLKQLKATRDQRITKLNERKADFFTWLEKLNDPNQRTVEGHELLLMQLAKEQSKKKLSDYHKYGDGNVDVPFLTPDVMKEKAKDG